ncbi:AP2 domain transcription factor AP2XI-1 [Toxoplasma gondii VAND]|uniref:AP2 domain transcription factor AP2XI-1 n=1 Tax=Toxoplasma gondii VAND TaxID=933077 RepID=A0A086PQ64_TOXGO|nr:AP2 domain transcription factor AP2XI-1 [Toxoplasma gondii VAND]
MTQEEPRLTGQLHTPIPGPIQPSEIEEMENAVTPKCADVAPAAAASHSSHSSASTVGDLSDGSSDPDSQPSRGDVRDEELAKAAVFDALTPKHSPEPRAVAAELHTAPVAGPDDASRPIALFHPDGPEENAWQADGETATIHGGEASQEEGADSSSEDLRQDQRTQGRPVASPLPSSFEHASSFLRLVSSAIGAPQAGSSLSRLGIPVRSETASQLAAGSTTLASFAPPGKTKFDSARSDDDRESSWIFSSPTSSGRNAGASPLLSLSGRAPFQRGLSSHRESPYPAFLPKAASARSSTSCEPQFLSVPNAERDCVQHSPSVSPPPSTDHATVFEGDGGDASKTQQLTPSKPCKLPAEYEAVALLLRARQEAKNEGDESPRNRFAGEADAMIAAWLRNLSNEDFDVLLRYIRRVTGAKRSESSAFAPARTARVSGASSSLGVPAQAVSAISQASPEFRGVTPSQGYPRKPEKSQSPPSHFLLSGCEPSDNPKTDVAGLERHLRTALQCAGASSGTPENCMLPVLASVREEIRGMPSEKETRARFVEDLYEVRRNAFHRQEAARYGGYVSCLACGCTVCGCSKFGEGQPSWISTLLLTAPSSSWTCARAMEREFDRKNAERAAAAATAKAARGGRFPKKAEKSPCHVYNTRCSSAASIGNVTPSTATGNGKGTMLSEAPAEGATGKTAGSWAGWNGWARRPETPKKRRVKESLESGIRFANALSQVEEESEDEPNPSAKDTSVYTLPALESGNAPRDGRASAASSKRKHTFLEPAALPCFSVKRMRHAELQGEILEEGAGKLDGCESGKEKGIASRTRTAKKPLRLSVSSKLPYLRSGAEHSGHELFRSRTKPDGELSCEVNAARRGKRSCSSEVHNHGGQSTRPRTSSVRDGKIPSLGVSGTDLAQQPPAKALGHQEKTPHSGTIDSNKGATAKESKRVSTAKAGTAKGAFPQRRQFRIHHMIPEPEVKEGLLFNPTPAHFNKYPKARGVWFDPHRNLVRTCWKENGKAKTVGFPVAKFGLDEARFLAVQLHQFKCPEDPVPSDLQGKLPAVPRQEFEWC